MLARKRKNMELVKNALKLTPAGARKVLDTALEVCEVRTTRGRGGC